jgi:hypothetical protein
MAFEKLKARWQREALERKAEAERRRAALSRAESVFRQFGVRKAMLDKPPEEVPFYDRAATQLL